MILLIDAGNTRYKWRALEEGQLGPLGYGHWSDESLQETATLWRGYAPTRVVTASVASAEQEAGLRALCKEVWGLECEFVHTTKNSPDVHNGYEQPERLGVDRWAALLAAYRRVRGPFVVVDAGTAITVDLVDSKGQHRGGWIAPGRAMLLAALQQGTAALGCESPVVAPGPGTNTVAALGAGLHAMLKGLIDEAVLSAAGMGMPELVVMVCGGDAEVLLPLIDNGMHCPDLVFEGIALLAGETPTLDDGVNTQ